MKRAFTLSILAACLLMSPSASLAEENLASAAADTDSTSVSDGSKIAENTDSKSDKSDKTEKKDESKGESKDGGKGAAPAKSAKGGSVSLPTRLASFTIGSIVGLPIAAVRRTKIEIIQGERDLVGDPDTWYKKLALVMPGFIAFPYGAVSGGASGAMYAFKNAWIESGEEPFSKDVFSLGDVGN